jgi:adenylyl-sulfate kinase
MTSSGPTIDHAARAARYGHPGAVVWLTGLSGAGKSTIARHAETRLFERGYSTCRLDGDDLRRGLNRDLDFSPEGRRESTRRAAEVAALFADAGLIAIVAMISPFAADRAAARAVTAAPFIEVYVDASIDACAARDPRGLYRRARRGEIQDFTGISSPYEPPTAPDLALPTEQLPLEHAVARLVAEVARRAPLGRAAAPSPLAL